MDVPSRALHTIHDTLLIDDEWTVWDGPAFRWLGHRLQQSFHTSPPLTSADMTVHRVWTTIPVVRDVKMPSSDVVQLLSLLNRYSVGEALVWDAPSRSVVCHAGAVVHEETLGWRPIQIADFGILALVAAENRADSLAELLDGDVAAWQHPGSGVRTTPDEMLSVHQTLFGPAGSEPSRFAVEEDMQAVYDLVYETPYFSAGPSAQGIAIEASMGEDDTSLIQLAADAEHPGLGHGLLSTLKIRIPESVRTPAPELAALFNSLEIRGRLLSANFGAWCVETAGDQTILAHARFTPNLLYTPLMASDVALANINRANWAAEILLGPEGARRRWAHEIFLDRLVAEGEMN